jgi:hypothetical protein
MKVVALFLLLILPFTVQARVEVKSLGEPKALYEFNRKGLYAIGRTDDLNSLVTVLNGRIYITRYSNIGTSSKPTLQIDDSFKTRVASLTYANVTSWTEAQLAGEARTAISLGSVMNKVLKDTGYELPGRFPFLLKGKIAKITINAGTTERPVKISEKQIDGIIVGFLTKSFKTNTDQTGHQAGSRTPEFKLEMHFVDTDEKKVGEVEDFTIGEKNNVALFMPR